jgi:flagellar hook-length control protein FliK
MPAVPLVLTAASKVLQERPSVEFVGPMPAVPVVLNAAPKMAQTRPSAEFVGPMPAMSAAELSASALVHPGRLAEPVGPTPAVSGAAAPLNVPVQPVPMATTKAPTPATQNPATQTAITTATSAQALPVAHQPDLDGAAISRDGLSPLKVSPDQKPGDTVSSDMVKTPVKMAARTVSGTGAIKTDGQQAATPQAVALSRDINAYAEKAATAPSTSTSSTGTSGSAQQLSGTSTVAVSAGQTGGQMSGQNQSGQGGGHASSQGFADAAPSRDAAERTMLHRLNTANAGWSDTMIKRLTSDLRSGVQTVRIILEPRHLGRLNVDLGLRDGRASIRIAAETAEAASLLAGARGQLGQLFEQSGMRLASFQTSAGGQDAGMDGNGGQQGQTQSDANGKNAGRDQGFSNKLNTTNSEMGQPDDNSDEQDFAPRKGESAVLSILA